MNNLKQLRSDFEDARKAFQALLASHYPGADEWTWHRACDTVEGRGTRPNDDTSRDAALAADTSVRAAWDGYIRRLHVFYAARDGAGGVLGR